MEFEKKKIKFFCFKFETATKILSDQILIGDAIENQLKNLKVALQKSENECEKLKNQLEKKFLSFHTKNALTINSSFSFQAFFPTFLHSIRKRRKVLQNQKSSCTLCLNTTKFNFRLKQNSIKTNIFQS